MRPSVIAFLFLSIGFVSTASADSPRPRTELFWLDDAIDVHPTQHSSNIIFLNPCWGGCTISGGGEDSRTNRSSIVRGGSAIVRQFDAGQAVWDDVVRCVTEMYEPFDVVITDQDPGSADHFEAIVAGFPQDIGVSSGVGGIAPFTCGVINNAITFSFANIYEGSAQQICETVAQETAHAFGLEHEYHCPDPMTYLYGCGDKEFRDVNAQCGEDSARSCQCGGATQNSVRELQAIFGAGNLTPPAVTITQPAEGDQVEPGFVVRLDATDNVEVVRTELYINGQLEQSLSTTPYVFNAPADLADGSVLVEVRAYDARGAMGSDTINVVIGEPCTATDGCASSEACVDGRCVTGPGNPGGLGETCTEGSDCASGLCGNDGSGNKFCAELCNPDKDGCPPGFDCLSAGDDGVCWASNGDTSGSASGGCTVNVPSGRTTGLPLGLLFGLVVALRRRRRRR